MNSLEDFIKAFCEFPDEECLYHLPWTTRTCYSPVIKSSHRYLSSFIIPLWVIFVSYFTLILGTFLGGWRVVKTMATKITRLRPYQGFCAETTSSLILGFTALLGLPVSSTHVANGAIMGVGATRGLKAVRWGMTRKIIGAWLLSMPLSALFSFLVFKITKFIL